MTSRNSISPSRRHANTASLHLNLAQPSNPDAVSTSSSTLVDAGLPPTHRVFPPTIKPRSTNSTDNVRSDSSDSLRFQSDNEGDVRRSPWKSPPRSRTRYDSEVHGTRSPPFGHRTAVQKRRQGEGGFGLTRSALKMEDDRTSGSSSGASSPGEDASAFRSQYLGRPDAFSESTQIAWTPRINRKSAAGPSQQAEWSRDDPSGASTDGGSAARPSAASISRRGRKTSALSATRSSSSHSNSSATARVRQFVGTESQDESEDEKRSDADLIGAEEEGEAQNTSLSAAARTSILDTFEKLERKRAAEDLASDQQRMTPTKSEAGSAVRRRSRLADYPPETASSPIRYASYSRLGGRLDARTWSSDRSSSVKSQMPSSPPKRPRQDTLKDAMARAEERRRLERERSRQDRNSVAALSSSGGAAREPEPLSKMSDMIQEDEGDVQAESLSIHARNSSSNDQDRLFRLAFASASTDFDRPSTRETMAAAEKNGASDDDVSNDGLDLPPLPSSSEADYAVPWAPAKAAASPIPTTFTFPARLPEVSSPPHHHSDRSFNTTSKTVSRHRRTRTGDGAVMSISNSLPAAGKEAMIAREGFVLQSLGASLPSKSLCVDLSKEAEAVETDREGDNAEEKRRRAHSRQVRFSPKPDFRSDSGGSSEDAEEDTVSPLRNTAGAAYNAHIQAFTSTPAKAVRPQIDLDAAFGAQSSPATPAPPGAFKATERIPQSSPISFASLPRDHSRYRDEQLPTNGFPRTGGHGHSPSISLSTELSTLDESAELGIQSNPSDEHAAPENAQHLPRASTPPLRDGEHITYMPSRSRSHLVKSYSSPLRNLFDNEQPALSTPLPAKNEAVERTLRELLKALRPGIEGSSKSVGKAVDASHLGDVALIDEKAMDGANALPQWLLDSELNSSEKEMAYVRDDAARSVRLADAKARFEELTSRLEGRLPKYSQRTTPPSSRSSLHWWMDYMMLLALGLLLLYVNRLATHRAEHLFRTVYYDAFVPELWGPTPYGVIRTYAGVTRRSGYIMNKLGGDGWTGASLTDFIRFGADFVSAALQGSREWDTMSLALSSMPQPT